MFLMRALVNEYNETEYIVESYTKNDILSEINDAIFNYNSMSDDETKINYFIVEDLTDIIIEKFLDHKVNVYDEILSDHDWAAVSDQFDELLVSIHPELILESK